MESELAGKRLEVSRLKVKLERYESLKVDTSSGDERDRWLQQSRLSSQQAQRQADAAARGAFPIAFRSFALRIQCMKERGRGYSMTPSEVEQVITSLTDKFGPTVFGPDMSNRG